MKLAALFLTGILFAQEPQRDLRAVPIRVQKKIALVIGNQTYPKSPLKNPVNDAAAMAATLRTLGFDEVTEKRNLTLRQMRAEIDAFASRLQGGDLALFYYAGHGVQANQENYLIPTDFEGTSEADLEYDAYSASRVRDKIEGSGARLRILILDACRNNPFRTQRDGARGLVGMASRVEGTFIAYATADNTTADDNPAEANGLFTRHLLFAMRTPNLDLKQIFEKAKEDVYAASGRTQRPFTYDGVVGRFYFTPPAASVTPAMPSSDLAAQEEIAFWNAIDKTDSESLKLYLGRYGSGRFAVIAERNLARLAVPAPPPAVIPPASSELRAGTVKVNPRDGQRYVWIPAGRFRMGCSPGDRKCEKDEKPPHEETIAKGFWMGQTEVTQAAYQKAIGNNPSRFKGDRRPADTVNWAEAGRYCANVGMRLPTEAEWEYAGRGGDESARYGPIDAVAWYNDNSRGTTHEVGQKDANRYGLYDMLGNVWEWVADWYDSAQKYRGLRGGSWGVASWDARVSFRGRSGPEYRNRGLGFRCAGDLP